MTDPTCCARLKSALTHEEGELRRLARNATNREMRGLHVSEKSRLAIENAKGAIAETKRRMVDHDADHAGAPETVAS